MKKFYKDRGYFIFNHKELVSELNYYDLFHKYTDAKEVYGQFFRKEDGDRKHIYFFFNIFKE